MTTLRQALEAAAQHHARGELADAAGIYRLVLVVQPANAAALNNLGLIAAADEAPELFRRAVAADPAYLDAVFNLGSALLPRGELAEAVAAYRQALAFHPNDANLHFRLGHGLQTQGKLAAAAAEYAQALQLEPDHVPALCNLGTLHTVSDQYDLAAAQYGRALAIDPGLAVANMNMVGILEGQGRLAEAQALRDRVPRPQPPILEPAPSPRRTVLVLSSSKGNVPLDTLLPRQTTSRVIWHVEYGTEAQASELPPFDVAFNAVGNADVMGASAERLAQFHARRPVLNPPQAVARTRRDLLGELLAGIPDVVVPRVLRLDRAEAAAPGLAARLAARGMRCPVLARPIVGHGGEGLVRADTPAAVDQLRLDVADAYYVTAYHDYRSPDGYFRKYRTVFVDRQPFPYHLAISRDWLVHYFSADMLAEGGKRDEERRFLEAPESLGGRALAALAAIGRRLDLDFAGIDFSMLPDGRVLVFEANATMLVHQNDRADDFPYKPAAVGRICTAFEAMLDRASGQRKD